MTASGSSRDTRFQKGKSGNPRGRPKAAPRPQPSAFDIVIGRTLTITQSGKPREVTVDEALLHRMYQDAIAGKRLAQRQVLKMILEREKWLAARPVKGGVIKQISEKDSENADEAMLLLGIAGLNTRWAPGERGPRHQLLLLPWAVQVALSRGRRRLSARDVEDIKRQTRDAETLRWPAGAGDDE